MKKINFWMLLLAGMGLGTASYAQETVTGEFSIQNGSDDVEQGLFDGTMYTNSSDIEVTADGGTEQLIGLRFANIGIPQGSIIESAYLQVTVDEANTNGDVNAAIIVEDAANPVQYGSGSYNVYNRDYFYGDTLVWNLGPFENVGDQGADQQSPDLTSLISYAINQDGWQAGNAIAFALFDPLYAEVEGYTGNDGNKRTFQTYENDPALAAKLVITYTLPDIYFNGTFPVTAGSIWLYDDSGTDLSELEWNSLNFADDDWEYGSAKLGYGEGDEATTLSFGNDSDNKNTTTYLRHIFEIDDVTLIDSLVFDVLRDDGVVVYVNGLEAFRMNMPEGEIGYNTYALSAVGGEDENTYYRYITDNLLVNGENVIAVELHQASANSTDLGFDMSVGFLQTALDTADYPFAQGSEWYYLDNGSDFGDEDWTAANFNDYYWSQGSGPFGYGDDVNTTISFGPDADNKFITTYFRRAINIDLASLEDSVIIGLRRDDGAIVYVNGVEVIRSNMPEGDVDYLTNAASTIGGADESVYTPYTLSSSIFVNGLNQLAVEVHNRDGQSSDLQFDLFIQNPPEVNPPVDCGTPHIGCFTSIQPTAQTEKLILPQDHKFQLIFKQGEEYTIGDGTVPGNHDFTAYLPINGSSENGRLSVNHENTPGGVSIVDLNYNSTTKLWETTSSQPVDFYNDDLVTTTRNCSGGITPWGTVITAEETFNAGDANNDGYQDVGWLVEIDPETAQVVDYEGDGVQDKLWAMGRMSHENVVIASDSITAYYGEDGGTQCVYKYVADEAANLSSGTVYVLVLDQPLINDDPSGTTGTWVQVPNETQEDRNNIRDLASALGGTNFSGVEDCEIGTIDGKVYFTSKGNDRVYRFSDDGETLSNFETFVGGMSYNIDTEEGVVAEPWGGGNDNLTFDDQGNLWVLQDGGLNYIWVVRPNHSQIDPHVELFASMPIGSEPTGLTFSPDYRFGFFSVQHPSSNNGPQLDASGEQIAFDASASVVFALSENLGSDLVENSCNGNYQYFLADVDINADEMSTIYGVEMDNDSSAANLTVLKTLDYEVHIAYNESENLLYLVRSQGGSFRTLDVSVADGDLSDETILDVPLPKVTAAVFDGSGKLIIGDTDLNSITSVDTETGETQFLTSADVSGGDLSYGFEGGLYLASRSFGGRLYEVDSLSGFSDILGTVPSMVTGMATTASGTLLLSAKDASSLMVKNLDGSETNLAYALYLDGNSYTTLDGDLAAGCSDLTEEPGDFEEIEQSTFVQSYYDGLGSSTGSSTNSTTSVISAMPNPTKGQVHLVFSTATTGRTIVEVYDMGGRLVETIFNQETQNGVNYRIQYDGSSLPNGLYVYRLVSGDETIIEKVLIAK